MGNISVIKVIETKYYIPVLYLYWASVKHMNFLSLMQSRS